MEVINLIVTEKDKRTLIDLIRNSEAVDPIAAKCRKKLYEELKVATIISEEEFPKKTVRIGSIVTITTPFGRKAGLEMVLPQRADIQKGKLSVLSPMGTALIGYAEGSDVNWHFPQGDEIINIEKVDNDMEVYPHE
jgi:regulator of nucleoside diphosphate kinase